MGNTTANGRRAALYLRVSTDQQHTSNQRPDLAQLARTRGWDIVKIYEETGSAAKQRPAFDSMMLDGTKGHFDILAVWSLDRLGRWMQGNLATVLELDRLGVQVV